MRHGGVYRFFDVPVTVFSGLLQSPDCDNFFERNIHDTYQFSRIR
ncbi:KTSC domain-containing protein [Klebsiella michiganensis]